MNRRSPRWECSTKGDRQTFPCSFIVGKETTKKGTELWYSRIKWGQGWQESAVAVGQKTQEVEGVSEKSREQEGFNYLLETNGSRKFGNGGMNG